MSFLIYTGPTVYDTALVQAATVTAAFENEGDITYYPCFPSGPEGFSSNAAGPSSYDIPDLGALIDTSPWPGIAVSVGFGIFGVGPVQAWPACAYTAVLNHDWSATATLVRNDTGAVVSAGTETNTGAGSTSGAGFPRTQAAPFALPTFTLSLTGDYHLIRGGFWLTIKRWYPDVDPPTPVAPDPYPDFTPAPPPLRDCSAPSASPPTLEAPNSGVVGL